MVERYAELQSLEELKHFYNNVKVKCREAVEYERIWCKKQGEQRPSDSLEIMPDKWYVCHLTSCFSEQEIGGRTWFYKGTSYLGTEILKLNLDFASENYSDYFRPWNIQDAKNGDVLRSTGLHNDCIFIFSGLDNWKFDADGDRAVATGYCCLDITADKMEFGIQGPDCIDVSTVNPATKEQCDRLFKKMKEAGYEWDFDKKELREIERIKTRKMTYKELSWWLREHPEEHREYTHEDIRKSSSNVYSCYDYNTSYADEEVNEYIRIRKNGGEWQEPLINGE